MRHRKMPDRKWISRAGLALAVLLCMGCDNGLPLAPVTGVVTLDGKPVKGALLEFIPQEPGGSTAFGTTDENGRYKMYFGTSETGAFIGKSLVRITSDDRVSVGGKDYERKEVFPPKYNVKSEEIVDVVKGSNKFDFECQSDGKVKQQSLPGGGT